MAKVSRYTRRLEVRSMSRSLPAPGYMRVFVCVCVREREREKERERERCFCICICMCACVFVCACVCVCVRVYSGRIVRPASQERLRHGCSRRARPPSHARLLAFLLPSFPPPNPMLLYNPQARGLYNKTVTTPSMRECGNDGGNKGGRACVYLQPCVACTARDLKWHAIVSRLLHRRSIA